MFRIGLALAGMVVFLTGVKMNDPNVRWGGIALVLVAVLLRFASARPGKNG